MLELCNKPELLEIMLIVKRILLIIKIAAPVIAVLWISFDIIKAVMASKMDEIPKKLKAIPKRLLALALVFLVPFVIEIMMGVLASDVEYASCFTNATEENIIVAYEEQAESLVALAEQTPTRQAYDNGIVAVRKLSNGSLKDNLSQRLAAVLVEVKKQEAAQQKPGNPSNPSKPGGGTNLGGSSTPGPVVAYSQLTSGPYGSLPFCTASNTIVDCGCGAVSLAMVASGLVNPSYNPKVVSEYWCSIGHSGCGVNDNDWSNTSGVGSKLLNHFGLSSERLFSNVTGTSSTNSVISAKEKIANALRAGKPVILHIPQHYVVLASITNDNRVYLVNPADVRSFNLATGYYKLDDLWSKTSDYRGRCTNSSSCGWISATAFSKK